MIFMDEHARRQLLQKGVVITFRRKRHKEGLDWATDRRGGKKICDIIVRVLCKIECEEDLGLYPEYVELSGFTSLDEWKEAIRRFIGRGEFKGYLYRVERL